MTILLDPDARPVIGHRGDRAHAPEDTLEAMQLAVDVGVDALECDVHVTRDGEVVVHHDATLERTTDGSGRLDARPLADLRTLDAGYRWSNDGGRTFAWRGRGVRIPTLASVLESFPTLPIIVELKTPAATEPARRVVMRMAAERRVILAGFDAAAVRPLVGGPIALGACTADLVRILPRALLGLAPPASLPFAAACIPPTHHGLPVPIGAIARLQRRRGGTTHIWTVNDPDEARRWWDAGANGMISDDPRVLLAARDGRSASPAPPWGPC